MLLISILLLIVFKKGRYMLCFAPLLMVFIGCLLSPVNGYYRYAYAMIIGVPIAFTDLLLNIIRQKKRCISARRESRQRITSSRIRTKE